jgi:hypothetical protein
LLFDRREELRAQSVKYAALLVKHEKFVCIAREGEEALKEEVRRLAMQFSENTRPSPEGFMCVLIVLYIFFVSIAR